MDEGIAKYTHEARGLVLAAWPEIVRGLIEKAASGGYQQTKLLLDLCGLTDVDASKLTEGRKQQLCDVLLEGLGLSLAEMDDSKSSVETFHELGTRGSYEEQQ